MIIIKSHFKKYYIAKFRDIIINITVSSDVVTNKEYLKFYLYTGKTDEYMDMYFADDVIPDYVKDLFDYIKFNNKISYSEDKLYYVIQGPLLDDEKIYKMKFFYIQDYNAMMKRQLEFIYDEELSLKMAREHLFPIYRAWK